LKRKLLFVVGAGASIELGMPSVADVGEILRNDAQKWYPLADRPSANLYGYVEDEMRKYYSSVPGRSDPQFEDVLYALFALASAYPAGTYTSPIGAFMTARELPEFIYYGNGRKKPSPHDLHTVSCTSVDAILNEFRKRCAEHSTSKDFARLKAFIKALEAEFEIAVVSVNYDNLIYRSLPSIETGFDPSTGRFEQ
jgi:hypothetical protein